MANFGANEPLSAQQLDQLQNLYWVSNLGTLEPVAGATILFYQGDNLVFAGSDFTDEKGVALTKVLPNIRGVIISFGDDSTVIPNTQSRVNYGRSASAAEKIYLYTDKPIYQPGQEVFIKGIHRIGYDGNYEIFQDRPVNLKVSNSKNDEISSEDLQINDFGTFDTKFILEKDSPLGAYRICVEQYSCISFDVQQFVPAAFEVTVSADKEEYISKDIINLDVQADYFFGAPVEAGKVSYTVSSQNYYFDRYSGRYFSFGQRRYYYSPFPYGDKFLLRGETTLVDGQAVISLPMDFAEFFANDEEKQSKLIIFDITVQNQQGQSVSIQRSSIVHAGELYLGVKAEKSFVSKNEEVAVRVKSVDIKGKEVAAGDVAMDVYTVKWIYAKRQGVGGGYSYIWEKQRDLVEQYMFSTDKNGDHTETLRLAKEGQYEIEVWTTDGRGNPIRSISNLYVYGKGAVSIQPSTGTKLELEAESTSLNVGEKGEIIIKSPYAKAKALITIERGKIFDYEIKDIQGNLANYTFIVEEQHVPNVFVSVLLQSADPEVKFGQLEFQVNTGRKELDIQVDSNKTHYLPGEEVTLDITATDYTGRPVEAEVSIAVVDLSVLALKGNPKRNPVVFFYGGFPLTVTTSSNLRNILVETEISSKGGGGLAAAEDLARKARGEFREVAFWRAVTRTDQQGKAQITFTLPDNLTRWQAESIGITKDTRLGVDYSEFTTRKDLMLIPLRPRFVVPGDIFLIGAKIFNQTSERQNLEVTFESQTLVLQEESAVKKIGLADDQTQTVYFKVQASQHIEEGVHNFVLSVHNDAYEDTVLQDIPITPNTTYETTATANFTSDEVTREYIFLPGNIVKEKGGLSVQSSATLAVFLSDALNYLIQYPYGCSEQISSRLNAIAIVKHGLNLPNVGDKFQLEKILYQGKEYTAEELVDVGLAELMNNQNTDGGISFWRQQKSSFYATLYVVETLRNLSAAGFDINEQSLQRAAKYLYGEVTRNRLIYQNKNNVILAAYQLFQLQDFTNNSVLRQQITNIATDDGFIHDQISNSSLAQLAIVLNRGFDGGLGQKINDVLDNRIDIDARGAFLEMNQNHLWYYYETPIKNTALYLKAVVARQEDNPIVDKVIRWLLKSRAKDGAWGTTNSTITVIDAFTDFLEWKRETESDFTLSLLINGLEKDSFRFEAQTILDQRQTIIPIQDFELETNNIVEFSKINHNKLPNNYYYDLTLKYFLPAEQIAPRDEGISTTRAYFALNDTKNEEPLVKAVVGDVLRVHLQLTIPKTRNHAIVEDYIPAGFEIINLDLATEQKSLRLREKEIENRELRTDFKELRNDRAFLYTERLSPGVYEFDYFVRALIPGTFIHLPTIASEMYFPETFGRTAGGYFVIEQ